MSMTPPENWLPAGIEIVPLQAVDGDGTDDDEKAETYRTMTTDIASIIAAMPKRGLFMRDPLIVSRAQVALYLEATGRDKR